MSTVVDFMNTFASNWHVPADAPAGVLEIVQSPVAKVSFAFEDKTRWNGSLTFHSPVAPDGDGASLRLAMLDGLMNVPEFFHADQTLRHKCFDLLTNIMEGRGAAPSVVEILGNFRGDVVLSERKQMCKCASVVLPPELVEAHATIIISGGEAVSVNHDVVQSPKKKRRPSTGSKGGGAEQDNVRSADTDDSSEEDEESSEDEDEDKDEGSSEDEVSSLGDVDRDDEENGTWEYAIWEMMSAEEDVTWSDLQKLQ